jgi:hypothetical protein
MVCHFEPFLEYHPSAFAIPIVIGVDSSTSPVWLHTAEQMQP